MHLKACFTKHLSPTYTNASVDPLALLDMMQKIARWFDIFFPNIHKLFCCDCARTVILH